MELLVNSELIPVNINLKTVIYDDFISRVLKNKTACRVKLADLADNMDLSRIQTPTEEDYQRVEKYWKAAARIQHHLGIV
jgi:hypothetical protein